MRIMAYASIFALCFSLFGLGMVAVQGQQALSDMDAFLESWLLDSCETGEEGRPEDRLLAFGAEAEPRLLEALENGPRPDLRESFRQSLDVKWQARTEALAGESAALSPEDLQAARALTLDQYVSSQTDSFVLRYRDRALQGLALIGTQRALQAVSGYASDPEFPLSASAKDALQALTARLEGSGR